MNKSLTAILLIALSYVQASTLSKQEFTDFLTKDMQEQSFLQPTIDKMPETAYSQRLIDAFKNLSFDMRPADRRFVLQVLFNCGPQTHNKAYVETVKLLSECMPQFDRINIMRTVAKVTQDQYQNFVDAMLLSSLQLDAEDLRRIFRIFCDVKSETFPFLIQFIQTQNFFFELVPCKELESRILWSTSQDEMKGILGSLYIQYKRLKRGKFPDALAFEIHHYAQKTFEDQNDLPLFKLVIYRIHNIVKKRLSYQDTIKTLQRQFMILQKDPKKPDSITKEIYDWMIKCYEQRNDQMTLAAVVSYLIEIDPSFKKLRTWLSVFMEESKNAYQSGPTNSCIQGVKERAITSLRSTNIDDPILIELFKRAEDYLLTTTKAKRLNDYAYWATKMAEFGVTIQTPLEEAKIIFEQKLRSLFDDGKEDSESIIRSTLDMFEDSNEAAQDGIWSNIKKNINDLYQN